MRLITVLSGIAIVRTGRFFGSELGFRNWQAMVDPPDAAFTNTAPLGILLVGRLPAGIFTVASWGALSLTTLAVRRIRRPKAPPRLPS